MFSILRHAPAKEGIWIFVLLVLSCRVPPSRENQQKQIPRQSVYVVASLEALVAEATRWRASRSTNPSVKVPIINLCLMYASLTPPRCSTVVAEDCDVAIFFHHDDDACAADPSSFAVPGPGPFVLRLVGCA